MFANTAEGQGIVDKMMAYGVHADGEVVGTEYHSRVDHANEMTLAELSAAGGRITRVRLLTERWGQGRMADCSYIHGTLPNGVVVPIIHNLYGGPFKGPRGVKVRMVEWAKAEGVFAKSIGLLDESNWSVLY